MHDETGPRQHDPAQTRLWALGFGLFAALLTTLPYLAAFAKAGDGWVFSGFLFGVDDGNSYIAKMLAGWAGAWLFRTPYTAVHQDGILAFLPYILLGKLAAPPELHLQLVILFHLFRMAAVVACTLATYEFIAHFVDTESLRRFGTLLGVFGGGLGWLLALAGADNWLGSLPLDFYSPETFGFLAYLGVPHLLAGRALLLWGLLQYLKGKGWQAGLCLLAASLFNPLAIPIGGLVIAVHWAVTGLMRVGTAAPNFTSAAQAGIVAAPMVLYLVWQSVSDPFLQAWSRQNTILSPHPAHYLVAYGLLLPWAVAGAWRVFRQKDTSRLLVALWALLLPLLAYFPYNLQRRLPEGEFIALIALAFIGLERGQRTAGRWKLAPFLLLLPSSLLLLATAWSASGNLSRPVFISQAYVAAFNHLAETAGPGKVVLSSKETGNILPAFAPLRVVIGHGPETVGFPEVLRQVEAFYSGEMNAASREPFLAAQEVDYIIQGPLERLLGEWHELPGSSWSVEYEQDGVRIFFRGP